MALLQIKESRYGSRGKRVGVREWGLGSRGCIWLVDRIDNIPDGERNPFQPDINLINETINIYKYILI